MVPLRAESNQRIIFQATGSKKKYTVIVVIKWPVYGTWADVPVWSRRERTERSACGKWACGGGRRRRGARLTCASCVARPSSGTCGPWWRRNNSVLCHICNYNNVTLNKWQVSCESLCNLDLEDAVNITIQFR